MKTLIAISVLLVGSAGAQTTGTIEGQMRCLSASKEELQTKCVLEETRKCEDNLRFGNTQKTYAEMFPEECGGPAMIETVTVGSLKFQAVPGAVVGDCFRLKDGMELEKINCPAPPKPSVEVSAPTTTAQLTNGCITGMICTLTPGYPFICLTGPCNGVPQGGFSEPEDVPAIHHKHERSELTGDDQGRLWCSNGGQLELNPMQQANHNPLISYPEYICIDADSDTEWTCDDPDNRVLLTTQSGNKWCHKVQP